MAISHWLFHFMAKSDRLRETYFPSTIFEIWTNGIYENYPVVLENMGYMIYGTIIWTKPMQLESSSGFTLFAWFSSVQMG